MSIKSYLKYIVPFIKYFDLSIGIIKVSIQTIDAHF